MQINQGDLLRTKIAQSRMKVQDVAKQAKLPPSSLYDMYKRTDVPRSKLQAVCDVLGISIREFYMDMETDPEQLTNEGQAEYFPTAQIEMLRRECGFLKEQVKHLNTIIALLNEKLAALQPQQRNL